MPKTSNDITVIFTLGTILQRDVPGECCETGVSNVRYYRLLQFGVDRSSLLRCQMALWSYGHKVAPKSCNEPEYAVVSNTRTITLGL
jgi:hypothetical protein